LILLFTSSLSSKDINLKNHRDIIENWQIDYNEIIIGKGQYLKIPRGGSLDAWVY
jgi:hypothetical protein